MVRWLRDEMKLIHEAKDSEYFARKVKDSGGVYFVPAFAGLGAPAWDMHARGTLVGLTAGTGKNHIIRAALEAIAFQTEDVLSAMCADMGKDVEILRVDGGASANNFLLSFQSDILGIPTERPCCVETTALGAAYLCGLALGVYSSLDEIKTNRATERIFSPEKDGVWREKQLATWKKAVSRCLGWKQ